jgi:putative transposase
VPACPDHLKTFDYRGRYRYSLTWCTFARMPRFTTRVRVDLVYAQILRSAAEEGAAILAYCFMPDHLHLLVEMRSDASDCLSFISRAKQYSGLHYHQRFGRRLWQRYGYEHVLRRDEEILPTARYIFENPVRAGLVEDAETYEFLGSEVYSVKQVLEVFWSGGTR